ncbi:MAG: tetratricopeptide repeat protein [Candidatus Hermodarchaeota archaeon]
MTIEDSDLFEPFEFDVKQILNGQEPLSFLVGSGISRDPPSNLASTQQIMEAIIRFGVPEEAINVIPSTKELRYEFLLQTFRDCYDRDLKLLEYFEQSIHPNLIHRFLARMLKDGHYVLTTNFDYLIERAIGLDEPALRVVITRKDFEEHVNSATIQQEGLLTVYKIHGSPKNPVTGEDTRESVITTLNLLGKYKTDEFCYEEYKTPLLREISDGRTLVLMGYSNENNIDIVSTLQRMQGLKRLVWITQIEDETTTQTYRVKPDIRLNAASTEKLAREDQILYQLSISGDWELIKVISHVNSLFPEQEESSTSESETVFQPFQWMVNNISAPEVGEKEFFVGRIFSEYPSYYEEAIDYLQKSYEICTKQNNTERMARVYDSLGFIYTATGEFQSALQSYKKAYELYEQLEDSNAVFKQLHNIGLVYREIGDPQKALKILQEAYEMASYQKNLENMARSLQHIGSVYKTTKEIEKALTNFQKAYNLFERDENQGGMARTLIQMGDIYTNSENFMKALQNYQGAYKIFNQRGALKQMAANLSAMGNVYAAMDDLYKAVEYHEKVYEINTRLGDLRAMAMSLGDIGLDYKMMGEEQMALDYHNQACKIAQLLVVDEMISIIAHLDRVLGFRTPTPAAVSTFGIYQGVKLPQIEAQALMSLEQELGKLIPRVSQIRSETLGFIVENNHVTGLGLSYQDLDLIPESVFYLSHLQRLNLKYNKLKSLPEAIGSLRKLTYLNLLSNQLESLPTSFSQLVSLQRLNLARNRLTSLSESFGELTELVDLKLYENQLTELPESFGNQTNLVALWLNDNQLTSVPENFGNLKRLMNLQLSNNQLRSLPESFGRLSSLQDLYLNYNQLTSLPDSFGELIELTRLGLDNNPLRSLPESFGELKNLQSLWLRSNSLGSMPESVEKLKKQGCKVQWSIPTT